MRGRSAVLVGVMCGVFGLGLVIGWSVRQPPATLPGRILSSSTVVQPTTAPIVTVPTADLEYRVARVVDGDTVELDGGERVRYIGIDTPESVDSRKSVECFGREAAERNRVLVEGKSVRLERDVSDRDRYGRLLRYVYVGKALVNEQLVAEGFAVASAYPPDVARQQRLEAAEQVAREAGIGLWAGCKDAVVLSTATTTGGLVKGNISASGERIYHLPECASYAKTRIDPAAGERWFATPQEAETAGWRKAGNCD